MICSYRNSSLRVDRSHGHVLLELNHINNVITVLIPSQYRLTNRNHPITAQDAGRDVIPQIYVTRYNKKGLCDIMQACTERSVSGWVLSTVFRFFAWLVSAPLAHHDDTDHENLTGAGWRQPSEPGAAVAFQGL